MLTEQTTQFNWRGLGPLAVADLGWGMHPPHQPKSNDFGRKTSLYFE